MSAFAVASQLSPSATASNPSELSQTSDPESVGHAANILFSMLTWSSHTSSSGTMMICGTPSEHCNPPSNTVLVTVEVGVVDVVGVEVADVLVVGVLVSVVEVVRLVVTLDVWLVVPVVEDDVVCVVVGLVVSVAVVSVVVAVVVLVAVVSVVV